MSAVVCGAGAAGLSAACALKNIGMSVKILEKLPGPRVSPLRHSLLWRPALKCLRDLGVYEDLEKDFCQVNQCSFYDVKGNVLARPMMPSPLVTINDDILLSRLRQDLSHEIEWDSKVTNVYRSGQKALLETDDSRTFEADVVIAADGATSSIRSILRGESLCDAPSFKSEHKLFGGFTRLNGLPKANSIPFQSWGPGRRFTAIPTNRGCTWVAVVSPCQLSGAERDVREELLNLFSNWHSPVPELIINSVVESNDNAVGIYEEKNIFGYNKFKGWEPILVTKSGQPEYVNDNPAHVTTTAEDIESSERQNVCPPIQAESLKQRSVAEIVQAAYHSNNVAPLVIYSGDSAGTIDSGLIDSFGLAIESGCGLATCIGEAIKLHNAESSLRGHSGDRNRVVETNDATVMNISNMKLHLLDFETGRNRRFHQHQKFNTTLNSISMMETELKCNVRNNMLRLVPEIIKNNIFQHLASKSTLG